MSHDGDSQDAAFNLRPRVELALAYEPDEPPAHLLRHTPFLTRRVVRQGMAALLLLAAFGSAVLAMRPPELVRGAIEHEYCERTLRGNFMDSHQILMRLGLGQAESMQGFPQLMRPCDIEGHLVCHLTTFFERGGMVTVFAFDQPVALKKSSSWRGNVYWHVITSHDGKALVLVSWQQRALAVARANQAKPPA